MKTILLPILSLFAVAMVKPSEAVTCSTYHTIVKGDTCKYYIY